MDVGFIDRRLHQKAITRRRSRSYGIAGALRIGVGCPLVGCLRLAMMTSTSQHFIFSSLSWPMPPSYYENIGHQQNWKIYILTVIATTRHVSVDPALSHFTNFSPCTVFVHNAPLQERADTVSNKVYIAKCYYLRTLLPEIGVPACIP